MRFGDKEVEEFAWSHLDMLEDPRKLKKIKKKLQTNLRMAEIIGNLYYFPNHERSS